MYTHTHMHTHTHPHTHTHACIHTHTHTHTHTYVHTHTHTHTGMPQRSALTVQAQNGRVEGCRTGEAELDDVVFGFGQQLLGLLLLLEHRLLAAVLLLLPRQHLFLFSFLDRVNNHSKWSAVFIAGQHSFLLSFLNRSTTTANGQPSS